MSTVNHVMDINQMSTLLSIGLVLALTFNVVLVISTSGTHYVASCPWVRIGSNCTAYISQSEKIVRINITLRLGREIFTDAYYYVGRSKSLFLPLSENSGREYNSRYPIAKYPVYVFKALKHFTVVVTTIRRFQIGGITLTPKGNCYRSYYTVTVHGYPFFTVFSFDFPTTTVDVKCPSLDNSIPETALENHEIASCTRGEKYRFRMFRYQAWYYTFNDTRESARLLNVLIQSDFPVYVVSGNAHLGWAGKKGVRDIAMTSLKPSTTWGKEYIVPSIGVGPQMFVISGRTPPFTVYFNDSNSSWKSYFFNRSKMGGFTYGESDRTLRVTADVPFGLYRIFPSVSANERDQDVSVLNLIPIEQWKQSGQIMYLEFLIYPYFQVRYYLITEESQQNVRFVCSVKNAISLKWHDSRISIKGTTYSVAEGDIDCAGTFYVKGLRGKMMIYLTMFGNHWKTRQSFLSYPYDNHQGEIYQTNCKVLKNVPPNDGVDNDCDGNVDEEIENGVDDDGDGLIDEDFVRVHSDGSWGPWNYVCDERVFDTTLQVRVRSCLNRSLYGKDCDGESIQCNEEPCKDPSIMFDSYVKKGCFCNAGCETCDRTMFECQGCRPGYKNTEHCLTRCPLGWTGYGCKDKVVKMYRDSLKYVLIALGASSALVFVAVTVNCVSCCRIRIPLLPPSLSSSPSSSSSSTAPTTLPHSYSLSTKQSSPSAASLPSPLQTEASSNSIEYEYETSD